jgi:DnaJ-class molecular chaperone
MEYQVCPVCNGNGKVSGGFYDHPGDYPYWTSDHTMEVCRTCQGRGIIIKPGLEPIATPEKTGTG